jgi:hypothetical protein
MILLFKFEFGINLTPDLNEIIYIWIPLCILFSYLFIAIRSKNRIYLLNSIFSLVQIILYIWFLNSIINQQ